MRIGRRLAAPAAALSAWRRWLEPDLGAAAAEEQQADRRVEDDPVPDRARHQDRLADDDRDLGRCAGELQPQTERTGERIEQLVAIEVALAVVARAGVHVADTADEAIDLRVPMDGGSVERDRT